jgi:mevalonate kinase|tara:strand:+ start:11956 stop:12918 length:963 start_codon:yes stop_codon:yes gene_type:complete
MLEVDQYNYKQHMKRSNPLFYGKILLFGEYGIIKDSMGLSIPHGYYKGAFQFEDTFNSVQASSNKHLFAYLEYLKKEDAPCHFNLNQFESDLNHGLYFDSSIPQGFGVGSSGALVAAIYDRYCRNKISKNPENSTDIKKLKSIFSWMENYFHGKSSGIDPTICYMGLPLLIKSTNELGSVDLPASELGAGAVFLLNSGVPGETQPMVEIFMDKLKEEGFRNMLKHQFVKYNDACIKAFVEGDTNPLFSNLKKLSRLVLENFEPMIPHGFHDLWKQGLDSEDYYLKLCGSGGGGFVMGFTRDYEKTRKLFNKFDPEVVYRF